MTCSVYPARASAPGCTLCLGSGSGSCALAGRLSAPVERSGWRAPWHLTPARLRIARTVRGLLLAGPVVALTGLVGGDYVGATDAISLVFPFMAGLAICATLGRAAAPERGPQILLLGAFLGGLDALLGFWSATEPYGPTGRWLPPVLFGAGSAVMWWWYDRPPAPKRRKVSNG